MLAVAGAMDIGGSLLKDKAAGNLGVGTLAKIGRSIAFGRIPVARSVEREAAGVAEGIGRAQDAAIANMEGANACD